MHLLRLTNLTSLQFEHIEKTDGDEQEWYKLTSLPNLHSVKLRSIRDNEIPEKVLLSLPNLTRFKYEPSLWGSDWLQEDVSSDLVLASIRRWTNLESFSLRRADALEAEELFSSYHTRLTRLSMFAGEIHQKWFMNLDRLKILDFENSEEETPWPVLSLQNLTLLEDLSLHYIEFKNINSKHLTRLNIDCGGTEDVFERELPNLVRLKSLTFRREDEEFFYTWLTALTALEMVDIYIEDNNPLPYIVSSVTSLELSAVDSSADMTYLSRFDSLKALRLICNDETDLAPISNLTNLEFLRVDSYYDGKIRMPFALSHLSRLSSLSLSQVPAEISSLPNLESLVVSYATNCQYTGFEGLPNLTKLAIYDNDGSGNIDSRFISKFPKLKELQMESPRYKSLQTLTDLEWLRLGAAEYNQDFGQLSGLTKLTCLYIMGVVTSPTIVQIPTSVQRLGCTFDSDLGHLIDELTNRLPNLWTHTMKVRK